MPSRIGGCRGRRFRKGGFKVSRFQGLTQGTQPGYGDSSLTMMSSRGSRKSSEGPYVIMHQRCSRKDHPTLHAPYATRSTSAAPYAHVRSLTPSPPPFQDDIAFLVVPEHSLRVPIAQVPLVPQNYRASDHDDSHQGQQPGFNLRRQSPSARQKERHYRGGR